MFRFEGKVLKSPYFLQTCHPPSPTPLAVRPSKGGDKMEITIRESAFIRPAQDIPKQSIWNSTLDLLLAMFHQRTVYFFRPNGSSNFFEARVLKEALSNVLVLFYPLAGRLGKDANGRIEVNYNAQGVLFVEAETGYVLDDLGDFKPSKELTQLVPMVDYSKDISSYPLLLLQLTYFRCGGVSLGVALHHTLADGISALHFINSWSQMARGIPVGLTPFLDRTLVHGQVPPTPTFHHIEYDLPPSMNTPESESDPASMESFKITRDQIITLKANAKYSTYEILAAHIWRCTCKARGLPKDQASKLYITVDGRSRLNPPLPPGFFGNVLFSATPIGLSGELESEPLTNTVERIHKTIKRMDDEYLRSAIDYLEAHPNPRALVRDKTFYRGSNLNITSWTRLPIYDADFGWGLPIYAGLAGVAYDDGKAYIMPSPAKDGSLSVIICLKAHHMQLFEKFFYDF